jgi:hypothetical protein
MMMNNVPQTTISQDRVIPASKTRKRCRTCGRVRLLKKFGKTSSARGGYFHDCEACFTAKRKQQKKVRLARSDERKRIYEQARAKLRIAKIIQAKRDAKQEAAEYLITAKLIYDSGQRVSHSQAKALVIAWTDDRLAQLKDVI